MRRYNSLNNSRESDSRDEADAVGGSTLLIDSGGGGNSSGGRRLNGNNNEEETPFTDYPHDGNSRYKRTFCLVFTLFIGGFLTLIISSLILLGHLDSEVYADRMIPLMILGLLMFIPGAYYARIMYKAYKGVRGFSYDQIPSCY